jgi:hypothetical protein
MYPNAPGRHRQQRRRERHEPLASSEYQLLDDTGLSVLTVRARHSKVEVFQDDTPGLIEFFARNRTPSVNWSRATHSARSSSSPRRTPDVPDHRDVGGCRASPSIQRRMAVTA